MVLYNRPDYTRTVLEALRRCSGISEYLILPHMEPGNEEVLALVKAIDFAEVRITLNKEKLGIGRNTYLAWEHGFKESDFIVHIEDDTVPARDCLRYMEYCREAYHKNHEIFSIASYNRLPCDPSEYHEISRRRAYTCWLIGLWKDRWKWVKRRWSPDRTQYATHLNHKLAKHDLKEIYPLLSRCQNIGAERGTFVPSPQWHRSHHHTEYWVENHDLQPGTYWEAGPLVTAVMITGMHKARYPLARVALECFKRQGYPNKELLIINHGEESLFCGDRRVRELRLKKGVRDTVGDLRNLGLKHAAGDFIISWDDDDWHHPERIQIQMKARKGNAAVLLKNRIHYSFENGAACYNSAPMGAHSTILHPRAVKFRYPSLVRGSDSIFSQCFKKHMVIDNDPALYFRFYHGLNLWNADHIMGKMAKADMTNRLQINQEHQRQLVDVLSLYRGWNPSLPASVESRTV